MAKRTLFKKGLGVVLAAVMAVTAFSFSPKQTLAETVVTEANPLTTVVKAVNVGGCTGGDYTQWKDHTFEVRGAGSGFDKNYGKDSYNYVYFDVQGNVELIAGIVPDSGNKTGMAGIIGRNGIDAQDEAAGVYYDYAAGTICAGKHGSSQVIASISSLPKDGIYIKLEFSKGNVYYTVAKDSSFTDVICNRSSMAIAGLDISSVGFFATSGNIIAVKDITIKEQYTGSSGNQIKKIVYDSTTGELIPVFWNSKDFGGQYVSTFTSKTDGNKLCITNTKGTENGDVRKGQNTDYILFPQMNRDISISADITINSIDSAYSRQGVAIGQFCDIEMAASSGISNMVCSVLQVTKDKQTTHNFINSSGSAAASSPKVYNINIAGGTYNLTYAKNSDGTATLTTKDSAGNVLGSGDVELGNEYSALKTGKWVQFGIAIAAADAVVTNLTLTDADGWIIYDQNDYYIPNSTAPQVTNVTGSLTEDSKAIVLNWNTAQGLGQYQYAVMVSVNGGAYTLVGKAATNKYTYVPADSGNYTFKVYGITAESSSVDKAAISKTVTFDATGSEPVEEPKNGLVYDEKDGWLYYVNDVVDREFIGLVEKDGQKWYVADGTINQEYTGLLYYESEWYYVSEGKVDTSYTGFAYHSGNRYYVVNGLVDFDATGLRRDGDNWLCVRGGKFDNSTGLVLNSGDFWYVKDGILDTTYRGVVENAGSTWYVVNGKLNTGFTGIGTNGTDFWYVVNGKVKTDYTGIYRNDGAFWYIKDGKVQTDYKGLVENAGNKWYVVNGKIDTGFTGIGQDADGTFVAVRTGKFDGSTGLILNAGAFWYVQNGILDATYTGIVENGGAEWLAVTGKLASDYTGEYVLDGVTYNVVNGKIIK